MNDWEAQEGLPRPLGVSFVASQQAWNFAAYQVDGQFDLKKGHRFGPKKPAEPV